MLTNRTDPKAADNPLDALRNTIELDNRFKTAFHGYDKRCVQDYIAQLTAASEEVLAAKSEELYRLKEENAELLARAHNQEKLLSEARADERRKLEGAINIKESMLDGLRQTNSRLEEENHRLQLQISDLNARLAETNSRHVDANASVAALNAELSELLAGKFAECSGIISSWQGEATKLLNPQGSAQQNADAADPLKFRQINISADPAGSAYDGFSSDSGISKARQFDLPASMAGPGCTSEPLPACAD